MEALDLSLSQRIARATAAIECEKVMARHTYYHAGGIHREEIEEFWIKNGDLTWAHNFGQMNTRGNYVACYADSQEANANAYYVILESIYPEVERIQDRRALVEEAMHLLVSPVIEVAKDGKTAKGLWYTPGCIFSTLTPRKEREGVWIWERYGADFIFEDGKWVYRNLKVCCDLAGAIDEIGWPFSGGMAPPPPVVDDEGEEVDNSRGSSGVGIPGPLHYDISAVQLPQNRPFIPFPYDTFSETCSYAILTGIYEEDISG
jgi:hypothetical protein